MPVSVLGSVTDRYYTDTIGGIGNPGSTYSRVTLYELDVPLAVYCGSVECHMLVGAQTRVICAIFVQRVWYEGAGKFDAPYVIGQIGD